MFNNYSYGTSLIDVDFDKSVGLDIAKKYGAHYKADNSDEKISLLRRIYYKNLPSKRSYNKRNVIPKIIHQIWLGPNPIPDMYHYYTKTWLDRHHGWQYILWTDHNIHELKLSLNKEFEDARSYAEKSDILRYEILKKMGGVYVDMDTECFTNVDELHHKYEFYVGLESIALNKKQPTIANNVIGTIPNHPIINETLLQIRKNWQENARIFDTKYSIQGSDFNKSPHHLAVERTMYPLSNALFEVAKTNNKNIIVLPSGYMHPFYYVNSWPVLNILSKLFIGKPKLDSEIVLQPETIAFHNYDKHLTLTKSKEFYSALFNDSKIKGLIYQLFYGFNDKNKYLYSKLYLKNSLNNLTYREKNQIPSVIHIVCSGDNINKQAIDEYKNHWQQLHPLWKINVWTENDIPKLFLGGSNLTISKLSESNLRIIMKIAILEKFGGIVVDANIKPISAFDELINKYGYFSTIQEPPNFTTKLTLSYRIIGSKAGHIITTKQLYNIKQKLNELAKSTLINMNVDINNEITKLLKFNQTEEFFKFHQLDGHNIAFPISYFLTNDKQLAVFSYLTMQVYK